MLGNPIAMDEALAVLPPSALALRNTLIPLLQNLVVSKYATAAAGVVLLYDYFLTLSDGVFS